MKCVVVYVFPLNGAGQFFDLAVNFIGSYMLHPAGIEHETLIICNGSVCTDECRVLFGDMPNCSFFEHDNSGLDVGAYQHAAREVPAELMVFFGASTYFKRAGWLARMVSAWQRHGDTLYGAMANKGSHWVGVYPHLRSTAFWMSPALLNKYPHIVAKPEQRYGFEHQAHCLTSWIIQRGLTPWLVSWSGEYQMPQWDSVPNGFHSGDQSNILAGDRITAPPHYVCM